MKTEIKLTTLPGHDSECIIGTVLVNEKDSISVGTPLFEVEVEKSTTTIYSTKAGTVLKILFSEGDTARLNDVLIEIDATESSSHTEQHSDNSPFSYINGLCKQEKIEIEADLLIIGAGPGGYVSAIRAAQLGQNVVIVEKEKLGGTCLNRGCIPTKALVASSNLFDEINNSKKFGIEVDGARADIKAIMARKDKVVSQLVSGIDFLMSKNKIKVIKGEASLVSNSEAKVTGDIEYEIKAKNIILATGSMPATLPIEGMELDNVISSDQALSLTRIPEELVIIGGGVIGMEFAFIYSQLGAKVTVVEYCNCIIPALDADICNELTKIAAKKGIRIINSARVDSVKKTVDQRCIVTCIQDETPIHLIADTVLYSTGRIPNIEPWMDAIGIERTENKRGIKVNEKLQTNIPNIYAIGDLTNIIQLAHVASHQGIIAAENIAGLDSTIHYESVPSAIFTNPEVATVGLSEKDAASKDLKIKKGIFHFGGNGKALSAGHAEGFVKIIAHQETNVVLGGAIIGPHASDLIAEIGLAVGNKLTLEQIIETIHAHPTTAEAIHEAALSVNGLALHS